MRMTRPTALVLVVALLALAVLAACTPQAAKQPAGSAESTAPAASTVTPATIRLGNLPTEDILPLWVAQQKGLFDKAGLKVEIIPFQSAQQRDAAFTAGAIDGFMGDMIAAAELNGAGFPARVASICLGSKPAEGRFGIVTSPKSSIRSAEKLANVPVGTSSGTIQEYVLDGLLMQAGLQTSEIKKEEVKAVPVRFQLLMSNKLKAAALPEPFLSLAVVQGAHLVADDTKGNNLSQTVLVFDQKFLAKPEGAKAVGLLLQAWDEGAKLVNADPNAYRGLLVQKARLPKPVAATYKINAYPTHQLPTPSEVAAVMAWMKDKELLKNGMTYEELVWEAAESEPGEGLGTSPAGGAATTQTP